MFEAEVQLLRERGHEIATLDVSNDVIGEFRDPLSQLKFAAGAVWSRESLQQVGRLTSDLRPEVVHVDNWFPLLSPSIYGPARENGAAIVQSLHNYRLLCPGATFYRNGHVCEDCLGHSIPLPGVVHGCYRGSRLQTGVVVSSLVVHRARGTWSREIDTFIALTDFGRRKFAGNGIPADRIKVKPNFTQFSSPGSLDRSNGFLYSGRLSTEKGVDTLLKAQELHGLPVRIAGTGPLAGNVERISSSTEMLVALGLVDRDRVMRELVQARALVFPSECYESFGLAIVEAFACATPVIASRLGAMEEIVEDGRTGLLFETGNPHDLAAKMQWANDHPAEMRVMGENARCEYEAKYTPERNYDMLMDIYEQAIHHARSRR